MSMADNLSPTYTAPMDVDTYRLLGLDRPGPWAVNGHDRYDGGLSAMTGEGDEGYRPCPEAEPDDAIARGELVSVKDWRDAIIYPGTVRDLRFYRTAHQPRPACRHRCGCGGPGLAQRRR